MPAESMFVRAQQLMAACAPHRALKPGLTDRRKLELQSAIIAYYSRRIL